MLLLQGSAEKDKSLDTQMKNIDIEGASRAKKFKWLLKHTIIQCALGPKSMCHTDVL